MNRLSEIELMRLLHGELPPERAFELQVRIAREPELAEELTRLEATWGRLELPPAAPVPRGFARSVAARAENGGLWSAAPTRVRVLGAALLAAGLALGVGLSTGLAVPDAGEAAPAGAAPTVVASVPAVPPVAPPVEATEAPLGITAASGDPATSTPNPMGEPDATEPSPGDSATPGRVPRAPDVELPGFGQMAALGYDLPADGESFGDEGTLADDFWQAFDETDGASGTGDDSGSGSEVL